MPKRFLTRSCRNDFADVLEDALDRQQVAVIVVDQEYARPLNVDRLGDLRFPQRLHGDSSHGAGHSYSAASSGTTCAAASADCSRDRATHTRRSASRSSMSTGFAM